MFKIYYSILVSSCNMHWRTRFIGGKFDRLKTTITSFAGHANVTSALSARILSNAARNILGPKVASSTLQTRSNRFQIAGSWKIWSARIYPNAKPVAYLVSLKPTIFLVCFCCWIMDAVTARVLGEKIERRTSRLLRILLYQEGRKEKNS